MKALKTLWQWRRRMDVESAKLQSVYRRMALDAKIFSEPGDCNLGIDYFVRIVRTTS